MLRKITALLAITALGGAILTSETFAQSTVSLKPSVFSQGQIAFTKHRLEDAPAAAIKKGQVTLKTSGEGVMVQKAGTDIWIAASSEMVLNQKDTVRTSENSSAAIHFTNDAQVFLAPNSTMIIETAIRTQGQKTTEINLKHGRLMADVQKLAAGDVFKVTTPTAVSAVRGTTFYLAVAVLASMSKVVSSDLFVDKGLVDFIPNNDPLVNFLVEKMYGASIQSDGTVIKPREFTPAERQRITNLFNRIHDNLGNPQFGIDEILDEVLPELFTFFEEYNLTLPEEVLNPSDPRNLPAGEDSTLLNSLKDSARLLSEGIDGSGNFDSALVSSKNSDDSDNALGSFNLEQGIVSDDRTDILNTILNTNDLATAQTEFNRLQDLRNAERGSLRDKLKDRVRDVIDSVKRNQKILTDDAAIERLNDRQTGKVFMDVHGNRVRTDQYIFHEEGSTSVDVLSLTLRSDAHEAALDGVSSFRYSVTFNQGIPSNQPLKDLPWSDFLNVVTPTEWNNVFPGYPLDEYETLSEASEFIVHEASGTQMPALYPTGFRAEFGNPAGDLIFFQNNFLAPEGVSIGVAEGDYLWMQGDDVGSQQFGVHLAGQEEPEPISGHYGTRYFGYQTEGLTSAQASDFDNPFEPPEDHPFFMVQALELSEGEDDIVTKCLLMIGVPIDNDGNVVDAPDFGLDGPRDFISPNALVNGGNYNLEFIMQYGDMDYNGREEQIFVPDFKIDVIITPEIFAPYGTANTSSLFPDTLGPDFPQGGCSPYCDE